MKRKNGIINYRKKDNKERKIHTEIIQKTKYIKKYRNNEKEEILNNEINT